MTVHVLIPVHGRLEMTRHILDCVRAQKLDQPAHIVVIDDGSTDGTAPFLAKQSDITVLRGDGSLWWGGSINYGLDHVLSIAANGDWVMFLNNDTHIGEDFFQRLVDLASANRPAAVGSVIRHVAPPHALLSIGPVIDAWNMRISDRLDLQLDIPGKSTDDIDALSGRGVVYPVAAIRRAGKVRSWLLPHYLGDYELSLRVRQHGYRLLVDQQTAVYSDDDYGSRQIGTSFADRYLSIRSPSYLPALMAFWWQASNLWQRLTLPFRILFFALFPAARKQHANCDH